MLLLECFLGANKIIDLPVYFNDLFHYFFFGFCLFVDFVLLEPAAGRTLPPFLNSLKRMLPIAGEE